MPPNSHFEISRQYHQPEYAMHSAHTHSYYEMYYLINGKCNLLIQDNVYSIETGAFAFIPADTLHRTAYVNSVVNERLFIEFTKDYIEELIADFGANWLHRNLFCKIIYVPTEQREEFDALLHLILNEHSSPRTFSQSLIKLYFQQLILLLMRHDYDYPSYMQSSSVQVSDKAIQKAMNYISNNYQQDITLQDIAGLLNLNPSYLSKKFKLINGIGFKEYLNNVRINQSEKLLLETNKNITEIAFECGYENSNYYGDAFKHRNGISPSVFRRIKGNVKDDPHS